METRNITKEIITHIDPAPLPEPGQLLQVRFGKVKTLAAEPSGIFKTPREGPVFCGEHGLVGDEHVYYVHGGIDRALHQYASSHYASWRAEKSPKPYLFQYGGFGENLVGTNMIEENVCIGDLYRIGDDVIVQVSEPRSPCYKLTLRFEWPRALKRVQRTGRPGWNFRVLQTGYIKKGDTMRLLARPNPKWSILNVKRVIQAKVVPLPLVSELAQLEVLTEMVRDLAMKRLKTTPKAYKLVEAKYVTSRVKHLTFRLEENVDIPKPDFDRYSFAQIEFGDPKWARSYSIVSGDMNKFTLGVALDDHSRGGSAYIHTHLKVGDIIHMAPGSTPKATEDDEKCEKDGKCKKHIIIIGGIGVTAFLPIINLWDKIGRDYEIHYAVRSPEEAAFLDWLPKDRTTLYAKSRKERLNIDQVVPPPVNGVYESRIYTCGPNALMDAARARAESLGYPDYMMHFESFGSASGGLLGPPFEVEVDEVESGRHETLTVPSDKTLLTTLREAGFDMTYFCEAGGCGACKTTLCSGKVKHIGSALYDKEKEVAMLTCVDRGIEKIKIELD